MKKNNLLMLASAFLMGLSVTSCDNKNPSESSTQPSSTSESSVDPVAEATAIVSDAADYLWQMYKAKNGSELKGDFTLVKLVVIGGAKVAVEWSVKTISGTQDVVAIVAGEDDNHVVLSTGYADNKITEKTTYELTASLSYNGVTKTLLDVLGESKSKFTLTTPPAKPVCYFGNFQGLTSPMTGSFFFALNQVNKSQVLYATGELSGNYLATTENPADAKLFTLALAKDAEGKDVADTYTISVGAKYVEVQSYVNSSGKTSYKIVLSDTASATWVFDTDLGVFKTKVGEEFFYLGTYNSFNTISASNVSYISGDNKAKVGVSQFPAYLGLNKYSPEEGYYNLYTHQATRGETLFATSEWSGNYIKTTTDYSKAATYELKKKDNGWYILLDGKYLEVITYESSGKTKYKSGLLDTPTSTWTWNEELEVMVFGDSYIGTYNSFDTFSTSGLSYISGDNASKIGVSQFPLYLTKANAPVADEPVVNPFTFPTDGKFTATSPATSAQVTTETINASDIGLEPSVFTVTQTPAITVKDDGTEYSNYLGLYADLRIYYGSKSNASVTFSVDPTKYTIKTVTFTASGADYTQFGVKVGDDSLTATSNEGLVYSYTINGSTFTVANIATSKAQVRFTSIEIVLEEKAA